MGKSTKLRIEPRPITQCSQPLMNIEESKATKNMGDTGFEPVTPSV